MQLALQQGVSDRTALAERTLEIMKSYPVHAYAFYFLAAIHSRPRDVEFLVEKEVFKLHRVVLQARSTWFKSLLSDRWRSGEVAEGQVRRIEVTSMSARVFEVVSNYIYSGCTFISEKSSNLAPTGSRHLVPIWRWIF